MKSLKTKVIMSAIVLVFALIATIGSTYAWFTVSNIVEVTSFNVSVESNEALLMKVYNGETDTGGTITDYGWTLANFSNSISITDSPLYNTGGAQEIALAKFSPVTALTGETPGDADYTGFNVTGLRKPTSDFIKNVDTAGRTFEVTTPFNSATGGYIQIKIWVLNPASTVVASDVTMQHTITGTYADALWLGTSVDGANEFVWGNNLDLDFAFVDPMPGTSTDPLLNDLNANYDAIADFSADVTVGVEGSSSIIQVGSSNVPELLTINIWAEGWDKDTVNAIMGSTFTIVLSFELK